jgi:hypothetical protein
MAVNQVQIAFIGGTDGDTRVALFQKQVTSEYKTGNGDDTDVTLALSMQELARALPSDMVFEIMQIQMKRRQPAR